MGYRPGQGRELLKGAIDLHIHTAPSLFPRPHDDVEVARMALEAGMRAIVVKDHHCPTSVRAYYAQKMVPGLLVFGGVALNRQLGGINPYLVEAEILYGAKVVWMPTVTAAHHLERFGGPSFAGYENPFRLPLKGIRILDERGRLLPAVEDVLDLIKEAGIVLGTGHLSREETRALVDRALEKGIEKVLIQHVNFAIPDLPLEDQQAFARQGVFLEYSYLPLTAFWFTHPPEELVRWIKAVGPRSCVMVTDIGNYYNPSPAESLRLFVESLLVAGLPAEAIEVMVKENPARLLGLSSG